MMSVEFSVSLKYYNLSQLKLTLFYDFRVLELWKCEPVFHKLHSFAVFTA